MDEKPDDFQIGNMMADTEAVLNSPENSLHQTIFIARRHINGFLPMVFDREYSMKEPKYMVVVGAEEMGGVAAMNPGMEWWKTAWNNEQRLDYLIEHGFINS